MSNGRVSRINHTAAAIGGGSVGEEYQMSKTIILECGCEVEASYDWVNGKIEMGILNNCINEYRNIQQRAEAAEARAAELQAEVERLKAACRAAKSYMESESTIVADLYDNAYERVCLALGID